MHLFLDRFIVQGQGAELNIDEDTDNKITTIADASGHIRPG
jgi:hypothetical protein